MQDIYPLQNPRTATRIVDGQAVVVLADNSTLFDLNEVASFIWEHADGTKCLKQIALEISEEFEVDEKTATSDAYELVKRLSEQGLLSLESKAQ